LPADVPIIAALNLPERLLRSTAPHYRVSGFRAVRDSRRAGRLEGVLCEDAVEAEAAAAAGADFLVLGEVMAAPDLGALCSRVGAPLYARGLTLERAWALGASGINALAC
jgi:hypothetical protein